MSDVVHPRCGKRWASNNTIGHCSGCCETFHGLKAFDMHRKGGVCKTLTSGEGRWQKNDKGEWLYGPRMTQEERTRLFGEDA